MSRGSDCVTANNIDKNGTRKGRDAKRQWVGWGGGATGE